MGGFGTDGLLQTIILTSLGDFVVAKLAKWSISAFNQYFSVVHHPIPVYYYTNASRN
jgi:hypothetical protein